jgi:hypothetical protein
MLLGVPIFSVVSIRAQTATNLASLHASNQILRAALSTKQSLVAHRLRVAWVWTRVLISNALTKSVRRKWKHASVLKLRQWAH